MVRRMTSARDPKGYVDPRDLAIAGEVRADIARLRLVQGRIAAEAFNKPQQWLNRRLNGEVAFTASELLTLGDYMDIDVVKWLSDSRGTPGTGKLTPPSVAGYLELIAGDDDGTTHVDGYFEPLKLVS
jgi:hypothetical protein